MQAIPVSISATFHTNATWAFQAFSCLSQNPFAQFPSPRYPCFSIYNPSTDQHSRGLHSFGVALSCIDYTPIARPVIKTLTCLEDNIAHNSCFRLDSSSESHADDFEAHQKSGALIIGHRDHDKALLVLTSQKFTRVARNLSR